ncbi:MAG: hypothetical protein IJS39_07060 [Synergistaceae bacterium]|nr:hypothetical protein [Synergistaceae bacterium]
MTLSDFVNASSSRKQSAQTKLDMLVYGVRDNPEMFRKYSRTFKEEHYAFDNGNWGIDKKRPTPTEIILPGGIVSKIHIRPDSPIHLEENSSTLLVCMNGKELSEFRFLPRPEFWNYYTRNSVPTKLLAQMYGLNCLNFNIFSGCEFHAHGEGCLFCSVSSTVDKENPIIVKKLPEDLADVCRIASEHDNPEYIIITGGSYFDGDREFDSHMAVINAVREYLPWGGRIRGNVSMMPPKDSSRLIQLYSAGVDNPSFNVEVWPEEAFMKFCPGKAKYVGFQKIISSLKQLVQYYGSGHVWSNFVAGLVPVDDLKAGFQFMAENGIVPGANIYHAEVNSVIGKNIGMIKKDYIRKIYSFAAELYRQYEYRPYFSASVLRNSLANEFYEGLLC